MTEKNPNEFCDKCGQPNVDHVSLHNHERKGFKYMDLNKGMHFDCYIEKMIENYLKDKKDASHIHP